jgi:hypothetical protein
VEAKGRVKGDGGTAVQEPEEEGPKTRIRHDEKANEIHTRRSPQSAPARLSEDPQGGQKTRTAQQLQSIHRKAFSVKRGKKRSAFIGAERF